MLEIIVSPLLQLLFEKLAESGIDLFRKRKNPIELSEIIRTWRDKLGEIEAVLSDAEQQQFQNNSVKKWLNDLQDWAYDLENILDEIATDAKLNDLNDDLQDGDSGNCFPPLCKVSGFLTCASGHSQRPKCTKYSTRIEEIDKCLQDILNGKKSLELIGQTQSREERCEEKAGTSSLERAAHGRVDEKREIIRRLLEEDEKCYIVIPVVGQGGIGKTTLAQSVYNDEQVKAHFDTKAWVCVSDVFEVKQITTKILNSAVNNTRYFNDLNQAHVELEKHLLGKRFLIVLDDVWSDEYDPWDQLQIPFRAAAKGSRLIVTTRLEGVAKNMLTTPTQGAIIYLKVLSDDDCWCIFKEHSLVHDDSVEMRTKVVGVVKGLPLAAKALGGLLKKTDKTQWAKILRSTIWSEQGGVLPTLRLSYHHLSQHLKRAFAYCSIIPKDHEFLEEKVVMMWMAEGFLVETEEESMEGTGHEYFLDLVSRSLFEPSPINEGYFIMHDLIHDLAQWAAGDVCSIHKGSSRTRYLSISTQYILGEQPLIPTEIGNVGQLRTFAFFDHNREVVDIPLQLLDSIFQQFEYMRVLSLVNLDGTGLPNSIGKLKHLRCLDLSFNVNLVNLPESIIKLCNLQTLVLEGCYALKTLVSNMELLIELRHLHIEFELPMEIGKLTNLRTLNKIILSEETGHKIRVLKNLSSLGGSLEIYGLRNLLEANDAQEAMLHAKSSLDVLSIFWDSGRWIRGHLEIEDTGFQRDVLNQLQPPNSLQELELNGYMASAFPPWLGNPSFTNMVIIKLISCLRCRCMPPLGQLIALQELYIEKMEGIKYVGPEFYGDGCVNPFPALKVLKFRDMEYWEEWLPLSGDNSKVFPCLEVFSISGCFSLRGYLPAHLPSLKELEIICCRQLKVSLPSCPSLKKLYIHDCRELSSNAPVICCSESITLSYIEQFSVFDRVWVPKPESLVVLDAGNIAMGVFPQKCLDLQACPKLDSWGYDVNGDLNNLTHVALGNYEALTVFLEVNLPSSPKLLVIHGNNFLKNVSTLTKQTIYLQELKIKKCASLVTVNNLPVTLRVLLIQDVEIEQPAKEWGLHLLTSLKTLEIKDAGSSTDAVESIPDPDLHLPSSLVELSIHGFKNLKFLSCSTLPIIETLIIQRCPLKRDCVHVSEDMKFGVAPGTDYWSFRKFRKGIFP